MHLLFFFLFFSSFWYLSRFVKTNGANHNLSMPTVCLNYLRVRFVHFVFVRITLLIFKVKKIVHIYKMKNYDMKIETEGKDCEWFGHVHMYREISLQQELPIVEKPLLEAFSLSPSTPHFPHKNTFDSEKIPFTGENNKFRAFSLQRDFSVAYLIL